MNQIHLRRHGGEAVYAQIARLLREEIGATMSPGDCLPAENMLALRFGVNRHTVRHAIETLIEAGLLERRHGKGTFVLSVPDNYLLGRHTRFTENIEALGKTPANRLLRKLILPAQGGVARRLALDEGAPVVWIESLRLVDERPICLISHFLPLGLVDGALDDYHGGSLHEHLANRLAIRLVRAESLISAALPLGDDAMYLAMPRTQPVLKVKSVNVRENDGVPVEYCLTRFRADRIQLRIQP